jgi:putative hemolysin
MDLLEGTSPARAVVPVPLASSRRAMDYAAGALRAAAERILGVSEAARLYEIAQARDEALFSDRALATLGVSYEIGGDLAGIPPTGPLVVVANHPFGAVDGLLLASLVARRRPDVRCLANRVLDRVPEARREMFLVDTAGGPAAAGRNHRPLRAALSWVRGGGALCVFPAGVVSHSTLARWTPHDGPWHPSTARLVHASGATVVPCFIEGANSAAFQALGLVHPALRTLWLVRELLRLRGRRIRVHVGTPIAAAALPRDVAQATAVVRARTDWLGSPLRREVRTLSRTQPLANVEHYRAFWATADQAPHLVRAIGAGREETFRAVGEGTGRAVDLDAFDRRYVHLCVWDDRADELVGAYRLRVLDGARPAVSALYTRTLFHFDDRLTASLSPGVELGRAFVRQRWQKQYAPLMLLWSAIGRYVTAHTRARYLFGAVSISAAYAPAARDLMVAFLGRHAGDTARASLVAPRHPLPPAALEADVPSDVAALNAAVAQADPEGKGVPVLLRHYLKIGARAIGFSVDPAFGHAIDALMVVDLQAVPAAALKRYLGAAFAERRLEKAS